MKPSGTTLTLRELIREAPQYDADIEVVLADGDTLNIDRIEANPNQAIQLFVAAESLQRTFDGFVQDLANIVDANTKPNGELKSALAGIITELFERMDAYTS